MDAMGRIRILLISALLAACATGSKGTGDDDDDAPDASGNQPPDANPNDPPPDANEPPPDADTSPQPRSLTQSNATTITDAHTVNCNQFASGHTKSAENRFYRVFDLPALGISGTYTATRIDFSIESAAATSGTMTLQVKLHTLSAAPGVDSFPLANLTLLYGQNVTVTPTTLSTQQVTLTSPVVVPAGSRLVVELFAPDMTALAENNYFFPGSNALGESGPTYIQATACTLPDPKRIEAVVAGSNVHWIMAVQGTVP
jgi:hypothetical protein